MTTKESIKTLKVEQDIRGLLNCVQHSRYLNGWSWLIQIIYIDIIPLAQAISSWTRSEPDEVVRWGEGQACIRLATENCHRPHSYWPSDIHGVIQWWCLDRCWIAIGFFCICTKMRSYASPMSGNGQCFKWNLKCRNMLPGCNWNVEMSCML